MNPRTLLAAALVLAIALTVYLGRRAGSGAAAAPTSAASSPADERALLSKSDAPPISARAEGSATPPSERETAGSIAPETPDAAATDGALLVGRALDPRGFALAAAEIWLVAAVEDEVPYFAPRRGYDLGVQRSTRTDEGGRFEFARVAPGTWWVGPANPDGPLDTRGTENVMPIAVTVEISSGQERADVLLRCQAGLWIQGFVIGPDGQPVIDASIDARHPTEPGFVSVRPREDGSYAAGPLPSGKCLIRASPFRVRTELAPSDEIWVASGATGVELRLVRGGVLRGDIVDPEPKNRSWSTNVQAWRSGTRRHPDLWLARSEWSDASRQTFEFDALAPGEYDVVATTPERIGVLRAVSIAAGAQPKEVSIELARGGSVRPRAEARHAGCHVRLKSRGALIGRGSPWGRETMLAPEGRATVELVRPDGSIVSEQTVDVVAGECLDVHFE